MAPTTISLIVFSFVFGGSLFGLYLGAVLPEKQLNTDSRSLLKLGMGLMGTMTGLVLGLQLGSAVSAFDAQQNDLTQISAKLILLDGALSHYGPETRPARELLRKSAIEKLELIWPKGNSKRLQWQPSSVESDEIYYGIQALSPTSDAQRVAKNQALNLLLDVGQTRWLMFEQQTNAASQPLLLILTSWLTVMFISLGIFAPRTLMAITTLFVCAISVSGAIFLILELHSPLGGLIRIPSDPLRTAILYLGH
jgi:hypothetical protein